MTSTVSDLRPIALVWLRRDLRLADNPALQAALDGGYRPLLVYIDDPDGEGDWAPGAAARQWLRRSLQALQAEVRRLGGRLLLRRGDSLVQLRSISDACAATALFWNRRYEPAVRVRDQRIKRELREHGLRCDSFNAALLVEPWTIRTRQGDPYRVFTPYWRVASCELDTLAAPTAAPSALPAVPTALDELAIDQLVPATRPDWDRGFWDTWVAGEAAAQASLLAFSGQLIDYPARRDRPDLPGTSRLSPHLAFGELSPRQILFTLREDCAASAGAALAAYVRELGWREFSYHLMFHFPHSVEADLTTQMRGFHWCEPDPEHVRCWQQGRSGLPIVDAGMRELWHTGFMHNRVRMIVASVLTKNLRYHWLHGARWFWDTLVDADLANNSQGWQWSAGTGADAAPYFRIFNPVTQAERFDPDGAYIRRWLPELAGLSTRELFAPWRSSAAQQTLRGYPATPIIDLQSSREQALAAWQALREHRRTAMN